MRVDGRRSDQLRPVRLETGYTRWAEGSVLLTQGDTVILCNATVEERLPPWMQRSENERGWVTAEYARCRAAHTRARRARRPPSRARTRSAG